MEAKAITRYIRIAPRKMRLVIDQVRSQPVAKALAILSGVNRKAARLTEKTLKSAQANAKFKKMEENRLFISKIHADGGPTLKRFMSRSMGRADVILKRTTHLSIVLKERDIAFPAVRVPKVEGKEKGKSSKPAKKSKPKKQLAGAS
jgi:large subunit ribosomal protein L22